MQRLKMETLFPAPVDYEVQSMIKFLNGQIVAPIEIPCQLCQVYGPNVMSKQIVRRWCRQFTAGGQHLHEEDHIERSSTIMEDFVELVRERIMVNRRFTIKKLNRFLAPCCTEFLRRTRFSESCEPSGWQSN